MEKPSCFGTSLWVTAVWLKEGESLSIYAPDGRHVFVLYEEGNFTFCPEESEHQDVAYAQADGSWMLQASKRTRDAQRE